MGIARLLAKGWILFCLFAGAHALHLAAVRGEAMEYAVPAILICDLLFIAMGLLFVGGFGASAGHFLGRSFAPPKWHHLLPGFNEAVFLVFVVLVFLNQVFVAPQIIDHGAAGALERAIRFVMPGQQALVDRLDGCMMDGGRRFASAFAWLLAVIYLASTVSRLKLQAGLIRLEAGERPQLLGPTLRAFLFGSAAVVAIQLFCMGSAYSWMNCSAFVDITGAALIGLAPLMLAYLIVAALASLLASGPEH